MWQNPLDLKIPQHYQFSYYQFCFSDKKYREMKSFLGHAVARIAVKCYHVIQEFLGKQKLLYFIYILNYSIDSCYDDFYTLYLNILATIGYSYGCSDFS